MQRRCHSWFVDISLNVASYKMSFKGPSFRRSEPIRGMFVSQNSTVTETASDEVDDETELPRVTQ